MNCEIKLNFSLTKENDIECEMVIVDNPDFKIPTTCLLDALHNITHMLIQEVEDNQEAKSVVELQTLMQGQIMLDNEFFKNYLKNEQQSRISNN